MSLSDARYKKQIKNKGKPMQIETDMTHNFSSDENSFVNTPSKAKVSLKSFKDQRKMYKQMKASGYDSADDYNKLTSHNHSLMSKKPFASTQNKLRLSQPTNLFAFDR